MELSNFFVLTGRMDVTNLLMVRREDDEFRAYGIMHEGRRIFLTPHQDNLMFSSDSLFIPCPAAAISRVMDWYSMGTLMGGHMPYYFSTDLTANRKFEPAERLALVFNGPATPHMLAAIHRERDSIERNDRETGHDALAQDIPHARYNCFSLRQGLLQHVAGVDLGAIDPALVRFVRARQFAAWLNATHARADAEDAFTRYDERNPFCQSNTPQITMLPRSGCFVTGRSDLSMNELNQGGWIAQSTGQLVFGLKGIAAHQARPDRMPYAMPRPGVSRPVPA